jgi:hypothetical protein
MRFVVEVITVGGGLLDFLGASCSSSVLSAPVVSVSMSVLLRGPKLTNVTESESYVTTDSQSATLSWNKAPIWGLRPDIY